MFLLRVTADVFRDRLNLFFWKKNVEILLIEGDGENLPLHLSDITLEICYEWRIPHFSNRTI